MVTAPELLELVRSPYHVGTCSRADGQFSLSSRICGDRVTLSLRWDGDTVTELWHAVQGCIICQASASLLCRWAEGRDAAFLWNVANSQYLTHFGTLSPFRQHCALLPLECLRHLLARDDGAGQ
jgi:nitrogen fixation NifU-like protein